MRFYRTDGLRKFARDKPRGRRSRKKYDPAEHDELLARRERLAAEIRARQELTKEEWRERTRPLWPDEWDDSDFDRAWEQFQELKRWRTAH